MFDYVQFILEETVKLLSIDSPTGYTDDAADFVCTELQSLGYQPVKTKKGGVLEAFGLSRDDADSTVRISLCGGSTESDMTAAADAIAAHAATLIRK